MIVLEKLLLLKSVALFKQMPDDILINIATTIAKEKQIQANTLILQKGEVNKTMYLIVSGKVKVHDGDTLITELHEREVFGELSSLSSQETISSVSAITDSLLLTINSNALYELMNLELGLSKGIIQSLCKRTQTMSLQIQSLLQEKENK